ncbi:hypothetical protein [Paenibacillus sp. BJ-4]|nr:hypothetical protein [Paenibacillus sp. BJ-4]
MARTREYASTITVTANKLAQMRSAQRVIYRNGGSIQIILIGMDW